MRFIFLVVFLFSVLFSLAQHQENIVVFKLKSGASKEDVLQKFPTEKLGSYIIEEVFPTVLKEKEKVNDLGLKMVDLSEIYQLQYDSDYPENKLVQHIRNSGKVIWAEQKVLPTISYSPNDAEVSNQDHLSIVKAYEAWDISHGSTNVIIAIVDNGFDVGHEDLAANLFVNVGEVAMSNSVDDDTDGYVDNYFGWDFFANDGNPQYTLSDHGVHVAGCASPVTDNNLGVAGVGFNTKLMAVKVGEGSSVPFAYEGVVYAADHGAQVINCSWGAVSDSYLGRDAVQYAIANKNCLVVAAAGNNNTDQEYYPASFDYVLSVASTKNTDEKFLNSNYHYTVDVAAPGNIYSTLKNNDYGFNAGTSMAAPQVAGAAALLLSESPNLKGVQLGQIIKNNSDVIDTMAVNASYQNKLGKGRLNCYKILTHTSSPGIESKVISISDYNDEIYKVDDTLRIQIQWHNLLSGASNLSATISSTSSYVQVLSGNYNLGNLDSLETKDNQSSLFEVKVLTGAPTNTDVEFEVLLSDGASFEDKFYFSTRINVDYINVFQNKIGVTLTGKGLIGYNAFNQLQGIGLIFEGDTSLLWESSLMFGNSSTSVSDYARDISGNFPDADFRPIEPIIADFVDTDSLLASCKFDDFYTGTTKLNVDVKQKFLFYNSPILENCFLVENWFVNKTTSTIENFYAGYFTDWDVHTAESNLAQTDEFRQMNFVKRPSGNSKISAMKLVFPFNYHSYCLDNDGASGSVNINSGFSDAEKFTTLSTDRLQSESSNDVSTTLSAGPFNIAPSDSIKVVYAFIVGNTIQDVNETADSVYHTYNGFTISTKEIFSRNMEIYPNPVQAGESVFVRSSDTIKTISVFDMQGRTILEQSLLTNNSIETDDLKSGMYLIKIELYDSNDPFHFPLMVYR